MTPRLLLAAAAILSPACAAQPRPAETATGRAPTTPILDGSFTDWPAPTAKAAPLQARATGQHLFIRFALDTALHAIQAAPFTTRILIDADGRPDTGLPVEGLGVELAALLSPPNNAGGIGIGSEVIAYATDATPDRIGHAAAGFFFLPTHASPAFEARIDRAALTRALGRATSNITLRVDQVDLDGTVLWSAAIDAALPPTAAPTPAAAELPVKPTDACRVLAHNVLFSAPLTNPDAFRRTIRAIDPDVILFQEWFNTPQATIQTWVTTHLGEGWTVIAPDASQGVAIATRLPVTETIADLPEDAGPGRNARFVGAVVGSAAGPIIVGSLHLKCCGGANSSEDIRRIEEARAINAALADALTRHPGAGLAIGGDYNLVGTRTPIEILAAGLGTNGEDLTPVETITLGDPAAVTWVDEKSRFSPGRLDWILTDPARNPTLRSFTLDTRRLAPAVLTRLGLQAEDSHASDHLPIVVDLGRAE